MTILIEHGDWKTLETIAMPIRYEVFVVEQKVPAEIEQDEWDAKSLHAVVYAIGGGKKKAIATGRLLPDGHIGRMAVLKDWRGQGVGEELLHHLMRQAQHQGIEQIELYAQTHACAFYKKSGFKAEGPVFMEAGIAHQMMRKKLSEPL